MKYLFIHIPRAAGSSIEKTLGIKLNHNSAYIHEKNITYFNECFKFCVVRNPWDRVVSWYKFHFPNQSKFRRGVNSFDTFVEKWFIEKDRKLSWQFNWNGPFENDPLNCQNFIKDEKDNIIVDYIAKFENLDNDWEEIRSKIGINKKLPHTNKSIRNTNYKKYYNEKTYNIVENSLKDDIDMFDYKF